MHYCEICKKEIIKRKGKAKHYFCNHKCYSEYKRKMFIGKNNPRWSGGELELECLGCQKIFKSKRYGNKRNPLFCSHNCYSDFRSLYYRGEKHPNFKNLKHSRITKPIRWQKKYNEWRSFILDRHNNRCALCKSDKKIEVHHIKQLSVLVEEYIKVYGKINAQDDIFYSLDNGIALCNNCHKTVHKQNRKNCWKPYGAISSRASGKSEEGSETRETTVSPEHPTSEKMKI